jgi:hypothetical protein
MKITLRQTGGFTALARESRVDTDTLPPEDARKVTGLLESSRAAEAVGGRSAQARDAHQYELVIEKDGEQRRLTFDETTVPPGMWPLIDFLLDRAAPSPPDRAR